MDERCTVIDFDDQPCGATVGTHEHLTFDLDYDTEALMRIRAYLGDVAADMTDEQLLEELRDGPNGQQKKFRAVQWRELPTAAFRRSA